MKTTHPRAGWIPPGFVCVALWALTWWSPLAAQAGAPPEQLLFAEIPSVFAASKFEQLTTEAPASITVITAETIERQGWQTLGDILGSVRGFYLSGDRNYDYLGVRGFGRPGDFNSRVLLLVDGHRVNDNIYESSMLGQGGMVDVRLIDRVEVVRGPGSSIYGSSAFFAVVNVVTRSGRDLAGARAWGESGTLGLRGGGVALGNRAGKLEYLVSGRVLRKDGEDLYFPEFDSPDTNDGIASGKDGERASQFLGKFGVGDLTLEGIFASREKDVPTAPFGTDFASDITTRTVDRFLYGRALYDRTFRDGGRLTASGSVNHYLYEGFYPYEGVVNYDMADGLWWIAEASYGRTLADVHHLVVGGEYRSSPRMVQRNRDLDPRQVYLDHSTSSSNAGFFLRDEIRYRSWLFSGGVRLDYASSFGSTLNPRLAAVFTPAPHSAVKLLHGRAFRAPNAYELYYDEGVYQKGNPELDPERISTTELVLEHTIAQRFRLTGSLFQYTIDDLISEAVDPDDELLYFRNQDRVRARGLEVEGEADLGRLTGGLSWVIQDARNQDTEEDLSNSPRHLGRLSAMLSLLPGRLDAGLHLRGMSDRLLQTGEKLDGHLLASLAVTARDMVPGLHLRAVVENLFDSRYHEPVSGAHQLRSIPGWGRSLRIQADVSF